MTERVITAVRFEDVHGRREVHATFDDGRQERLLGFFDDLCGHPHKSAYAELRVMPSTR